MRKPKLRNLSFYAIVWVSKKRIQPCKCKPWTRLSTIQTAVATIPLTAHLNAAAATARTPGKRQDLFARAQSNKAANVRTRLLATTLGNGSATATILYSHRFLTKDSRSNNHSVDVTSVLLLKRLAIAASTRDNLMRTSCSTYNALQLIKWVTATALPLAAKFHPGTATAALKDYWWEMWLCWRRIVTVWTWPLPATVPACVACHQWPYSCLLHPLVPTSTSKGDANARLW